MKYFVGLLLLVSFVGCIDYVVLKDEDLHGRIGVDLSTSVLLSGLPSTKALDDGASIDDFVVWVFSDNKFVEAIYKNDTYTEDGVEHPMVNLKDNGDMFILLQDGLKNVTLAMVANMSDLRSIEPDVGTPREEANASFAYNVTKMPMYGWNKTSFDVKLGAYGGLIELRRTMAKIEVDASKAADHFELQKMYMYYPNENGYLLEANEIQNETSTGTMDCLVGDNRGYVYLPEVDLSSQSDGQKSCVILEGLYNGVKAYYKLDFIGQNTESGDVSYYYLDKLSRNYKYIFDIQYLTAGTGYSVLMDALNSDASNIVPEGNISLVMIYDQEIKDVTTNNYIYLGVTSSQLQTTIGEDYYVANVSVVTNSEKGWRFETPLPEGVNLSIEQYTPDVPGEVVSVWVYIDKTMYSTGDVITLYVYGENIRKSITVVVEEYIVYEDDFEWFAEIAAANEAGDAVGTNNPDTTYPNVFTMDGSADFLTQFAERGYKFLYGTIGSTEFVEGPDPAQSNSRVMYLQTNYLRFGKTSWNGAIRLPALSTLTAPTDVVIEFDWCWQITGGAKADLMTIQVDATAGTFADSGASTSLEYDSAQSKVDGESKIEWQHVKILLKGATAETVLTIRPTNADPSVQNPDRNQNRWYLDNIKITNAVGYIN